MSTTSGDGLRALVAVAVREAVADMVTDSVRDALTGVTDATAGVTPTPPVFAPGHVAPVSAPAARPAPPGRNRVEDVRMSCDGDLEAFARHLLALFENPKNRQDLRAGRYRFRLVPGQMTGTSRAAPARRFESGAVTERQIVAAAEAGENLLLARSAVLTPLAREKARALGVNVEKER